MLQQENRKITSYKILKRKLNVFFLSFLSSFLLDTCKQVINSKNRQNGYYQVALKNNKATIDNHQNFELITKLPSENISRQPRWASQPIAAHSPYACIKVSSPQVTKASIKASQRGNLLGQEHSRPRTTPPHHQQQNIKNTTTVKITSPSLNHHHTINPAHVLSNREDSHPSTPSKQTIHPSQRPTWSHS
jgi:hypothetical protein